MKYSCRHEQSLDFTLSLNNRSKLKLKFMIAFFIAFLCFVVIKINSVEFSKAVATTEYTIIDVETVYDEVGVGEKYSLPQFVTAYYAKKATSTIATTIEMEVEWERGVNSQKCGVHVINGVLKDLIVDEAIYTANSFKVKAYIKVGEKIEARSNVASFDFQNYEPKQSNKLPINENGIKIESEYRAIDENGQTSLLSLDYNATAQEQTSEIEDLQRMLNFTSTTKNNSIKITVPKYVDRVTISYKPIAISAIPGSFNFNLIRASDGQTIQSNSIEKQNLDGYSVPCDYVQCEIIDVEENGNEFYLSGSSAFLLSNVLVETFGGFVLQDTDKYYFSNENDVSKTVNKDGYKFCGWYRVEESSISDELDDCIETELQAKFVKTEFSVGINQSINALRFTYIITFSNADEKMMFESLNDFVGEFHLFAEGGKEAGVAGNVNCVKVDVEARQIQFAIQITNIPEDKKDAKIRCLINLTLGGHKVIANSDKNYSFNDVLQELTN